MRDSTVLILSFSGSSFEYFFSLTNTAMQAKIKGNIEVILKIYRLSNNYKSLPEEYAVTRVPVDLIPKKKVTF